MDKIEANKIIAEYMGTHEPYFGGSYGKDTPMPDNTPCYISLDALVPVWEKLLGINYCEIFAFGKTEHNKYSAWFEYQMEEYEQIYLSEGETLPESAAIATVKAIEGLKK